MVPFVLIAAWFAILFTGAYPRGIFDFVTGVVRWWFQVTSYVFALQDRFPPFGLSATATRSSQGAVMASAIGGSVLAATFAAIGIFAVVSGNRPYVEEIRDQSLAAEEDTVTTRVVSFGGNDGPPIEVTLTYVLDPGEDFIPILIPSRDAAGTRGSSSGICGTAGISGWTSTAMRPGSRSSTKTKTATTRPSPSRQRS